MPRTPSPLAGMRIPRASPGVRSWMADYSAERSGNPGGMALAADLDNEGGDWGLMRILP